MKIEFDLKKISEISPNNYLILSLISINRKDLVSNMLEIDYFTYSNCLFKLCEKGYLINTSPVIPIGQKLSGKQFEITDEGIKLLDVKSLKAVNVSEAKIENWIDDWRNIFPKGKTRNGNPIKGSRLNCIKKMNLFIKTYKFSKQTIFKATQNYIDGLKGDYDFIQTAQNFIEKNRTSNLASYCELIDSGYEEDIKTDNVMNI